MSKLTQDQLQSLVTKAALDPAFRKTLKDAPQEAAATLVELDDTDLEVLAILSSDLERFAHSPLDPIDAKSWAMGICYLHH